MRFVTLILTLLICLSTIAKEKKLYVVQYDVALESVTCDRDCGFVQDIIDEPFTDLNGIECHRYRYVDDKISMSWYVSDYALNYTIVNKTSEEIILHWSSILMTDFDGHRCGLGYTMQKPKTAEPLTVLPLNFLSGLFIPLAHYPADGSENIAPLIPSLFTSKSMAEHKARHQTSKEMVLTFPLIFGNERYVYNLHFRVSDIVDISEKRVMPTTFRSRANAFMQPLEPDGLAQYPDTLRKLITYAARYSWFTSACPQERVYLHLDNTAYFQGETIWYAANVVADAHADAPLSKVLYVELLSPTGVMLKQQKLKIEDGRCHGSFSLIDNAVEEAVERRGIMNYPSGYYQIRAYTRSMLNFDETGIFSRIIPVYKSPEKDGDYANPVMQRYTNNETNRPVATRKERPENLNISFFPEGGHLISGVPCIMAFKATDANGLGVDIDELRDSQGQPFTLGQQHAGMSSFVYMSDTGKEKVTASYKGKTYSFVLPEAESEGCSMRMYKRGGRQHVHVSCRNIATDDLLAWMVTCRGRVYAFDTIHVSPKVQPTMIDTAHTENATLIDKDFLLPMQRMPAGVCQFTLYDASGNIYAQRLFFSSTNMPTDTITTTVETSIKPFSEVKLGLQASSRQKETFSLAVRDAADYGSSYRDDIRTYMLLSSELKGLIEEPEWYFEKNMDHSAQLDNLMLVQGWTRYNWHYMTGNEPFRLKHFTEDELVLDGWAFSRIMEKPLKDVRVHIRLYSPDRKQVQEATVITDSLGYWSLGLQDFEGEWDLFMQTLQQQKGKENTTTRVRLERSSRPTLQPYQPIEMYIPGSIWNANIFSTNNGEDDDDNFQMPTDAHLLDEVEVTGRRMYIDYCTFKAYDAAKDTEIQLDEGKYTYKVIDYLAEKGYDVDYFSGRLRNMKTYYFISKNKRRYFQNNTMEPGWKWDMENIKSVIVYDRLRDFPTIPVVRLNLDQAEINAVINKFGGAYVVEIELPDKIERKQQDKNMRQTTFAGYTVPVEFYAPTYPNGPVQGDKDYRRTIYWNPCVTTDAEGKALVSFYNNGYSRSLTVSAEGMTENGIPILNE